MTNYERITGMSIEEMSCFFEEIFDGCINCVSEKVCNMKDSCKQAHKKWLESEVLQ